MYLQELHLGAIARTVSCFRIAPYGTIGDTTRKENFPFHAVFWFTVGSGYR